MRYGREMQCATCEAQTSINPCTACGAEALLDGRYALLGAVGRGSSGTTWEARAPDGTRVALKEMVLARHDTEKSRALWEREASVLRQLNHPQIPSFVEVFSTGQGRTRSLCLVQEFVEGQTLAAELEDHRYTEAEVLAIGEELAGILRYLHGLSPPVIHRDLKPANVIRRPDGSLALIDFGSVRDSLKDVQLGGSTVAGTFGFMAPEQFRGDAVPATDYYALGALLAALLTRKQPAAMLGHDRRLAWQDHCAPSPAMRSVLTGLLTADPAARSTDLDRLRNVTYAEPVASPAAELFEPTVDELPVRTAPEPPQNPAFVALLRFGWMTFVSVATTVVFVTLGFMFLVLAPSSPGPTPPPPERSVSSPPAVVSVPPEGFVYNARPDALTVLDVADPVVMPAGTFRPIALDGDLHPIFRWSDGVTLYADGLDPEHMIRCDVDGCSRQPIPQVDSKEAVWSRPLMPVWPEGVSDSEGEVCRVDTWIGADGAVAATRAQGCSTPFAAEAERALREWAMAPGEPRRTQVTVRFQLDEE